MRKLLLFCLPALFAGASASAQGLHTNTNYTRYGHYQKPPRFTPLDYGAIQPTGWLKDWCLTAKNGLVMHNKAFDKGWIAGQPLSFLNEQTAYWIDGRMRLGIVLRDREMLESAEADIRSVIEHRYLGPSSWSSAVYSRAILAYYLYTNDQKALNYLIDFFREARLTGFYEYEIAKDHTPAEIARVVDNEPRNLVQTEALFETYALSGATGLINKAQQAFDGYRDHFVGHWIGYNVNDCVSGNGCINSMHGVTYNELAKLWAIAYQFNGDPQYLQTSVNAYRFIDSLHMMPQGVNSAMENLMGVGPTVGTETCDVADFINSNTWMYRITGKAAYGDRIEKAFFNAAPASVDADFKQLVYLQSPNNLNLQGKFTFEDVHNPKCCSGNQARLIPNYILHMLMATTDNGIAFNLYGPCKAEIYVADSVKTTLVSQTAYPFENTINITVNPAKAARFPVYFRIPGWSTGTRISVNGSQARFKTNADGFAQVSRNWQKGDRITIRFDRKVKVNSGVTWSNNAISSITKGNKIIPGRAYQTVTYGPLLFALNVPAGAPYNFALTGTRFTMITKNTFNHWNWRNAPLQLKAAATPVNWTDAPELPDAPLKTLAKTQTITLVPYGSTHGTRITMFPQAR